MEQRKFQPAANNIRHLQEFGKKMPHTPDFHTQSTTQT